MHSAAIARDKILHSVRRPGRYIGGELNASVPVAGSYQAALAFPDLYEIGFPYLGFQILYHLLNEIEGVSCQRVYAPDADVEEALRREKTPLFTIEAGYPLKNLNLIGFTLQYELHSTTILNMLDLGGIPLYAQDRPEDYPLIIGGGPLAFSPEPLAPFFDAFLVGDAESILPQVMQKLKGWKLEGIPKSGILSRLAELPGVYAPSLYQPRFDRGGRFAGLEKLSPQAPDRVSANHEGALQAEYYPFKPLVPLISVEHDRLSVEVMRGCSRGCRFCNAGIIHRPTRERPVEDLIRFIERGLESTGYDELSLLSLSTADFSALPGLLPEISALIEGKGISLSYPSMRPDAFTQDIARSISSGRKTGLTFAPEAGTERLRAVINKDLRDEDLFRALKIAAEAGWKSAKLYFMVGLPTETDRDLNAVADLALKCRGLLGSSRRAPLHISLSVFSPKPHTPFQWEAQVERDEVKRRIALIKRRLNKPGIKVSYHDPEMTSVETLLARGDRRLAKVIERVYRDGARLEGWSEKFDFRRWEAAMTAEGLSWDFFTGEFEPVSPLPWDIIATGVSREHLLKERQRSRAGIMTPDCRWKCSQCGLECPPPPKPQNLLWKAPLAQANASPPKINLRFKFTRTGPSRWISHLETVKLLERSLRRAEMPLAFSRGFHPHPKISYGPALPVGFETSGDYFDVQLTEPVSNPGERLNRALHGGVGIVAVRDIPLAVPSLSSVINYLTYEIALQDITPRLRETIAAWKEKAAVVILDRNDVRWDISPLIRRFQLNGRRLRLDLLIENGKSPRPDRLLESLGYSPGDADYKREGCYVLEGSILNDPLELF